MDNKSNYTASNSPSSRNYDFSAESTPEFRPRGRPLTGRHHFVEPRVRRHLFPSNEPQQFQYDQPQLSNWQPMPIFPNQPQIPAYPAPSIAARNAFRPGRECKFCKNNGESRDQYSSHVLRNPANGQLICPILRSHVCEICGQSGDLAHTRNYCPQLKQEKKMKYAIPCMLKNTKRQSDGQLR